MSDIVTSGKTSVSEVVTALIDQFADEEEFLIAEVEDAGTIDQTTFSKDIMKQIEKVQKKQDKELNDVKSITQSVTREFNKDSKSSISTDKRTAKTDVTTAYKEAETELKALIDERGIRNVISKIKKIISEGCDIPTNNKVITETTRKADLTSMINREYHKSTTDKDNSTALNKGYTKEIEHGWIRLRVDCD